MQKITPFLWFDKQAEETANFYVSVFANSRLVKITRYGDGSPMPKGIIMTASFLLDGQRVMSALMTRTKLDIETLIQAQRNS